MVIDTEKLRIRDITLSDEEPFIEMASDGSLNDIGFDRNCGSCWMLILCGHGESRYYLFCRSSISK